jgi:hypothetical protein
LRRSRLVGTARVDTPEGSAPYLGRGEEEEGSWKEGREECRTQSHCLNSLSHPPVRLSTHPPDTVRHTRFPYVHYGFDFSRHFAFLFLLLKTTPLDRVTGCWPHPPVSGPRLPNLTRSRLLPRTSSHQDSLLLPESPILYNRCGYTQINSCDPRARRAS